jgi:hypothetical protein
VLTRKTRIAVAALALLGATCAQAELTTFQSWNGNIGYSSDGWGSTDTSGEIQAFVPLGSTVLAAYLYTSLVFGADASATYTATLNGSDVTFGPTVSQTLFPFLASARADVTSIVKPVIDGGAGGLYSFSLSEGNTSLQDGEALFVIYSNAALPNASFGLLDGFSNTGGDTTSINFATPLNPAAPGFFAEMVLGIGFSCCNQNSNVTVNGTLITQNAGNRDDGAFTANGSLITVGGFNDPYSPLLPSYDEDHERYNIAPYLNAGDLTITVHTNNPTNDDNIFVAGFYVSGAAGFNEPPPPIPEPETYALMLAGLGLVGYMTRRRRRA